jgi:hypothetical protein
MKGRADQIAKALIGGLLFPTGVSTRTLSNPVLGAIVIILFLTPFFALPPIREVMRHAMASTF